MIDMLATLNPLGSAAYMSEASLKNMSIIA